jgi:hypothetical protein
MLSKLDEANDILESKISADKTLIIYELHKELNKVFSKCYPRRSGKSSICKVER